MRNRRRTFTLALVFAVLTIGLLYLYNDYMTIDRCVDAGGSWKKDPGRCVGMANSVE